MRAGRQAWRGRVPVFLLIGLIFGVSWIRSGHHQPAHLSFRLSGQSSTASGSQAASSTTTPPNAVTAISGQIESVDGSGPATLYPGVQVRLVLSVRNTKPAAMTVDDLAVAVGDASSACRGDNLTVQQPAGSLNVPGGSTAKLAVVLKMAATAPDACKNVAFPMSFSGTASGADDPVAARRADATPDSPATPAPSAEPAPTDPPAPAGVASPPADAALQLDLGTDQPGEPAKPGTKIKLGGVSYPASCTTVYFFVDDVRIGSAHPGPDGKVSKDGIAIPGDTTTGTHRVRTSCSASGHPTVASVAVQVVEPEFHLSGFVTSVPTPGQVDFSPKGLGKTAGVMLLLIVIIAFSSELFNVVFETNYDQIRGWIPWGGGGSEDDSDGDSDRSDGSDSGDGAEAADGGAADAGPTGRVRRAANFVVFLLIGGTLFALLDPRFGFNRTSIALVAGMTLALLVLTVAWWGPYLLHMRRHHGEWGALNVVWGSLAVGAGSVMLSRFLHFLPGFLFGVLAGLEFETELEDKIEGRMSAVCSLSMTIVALGAWFLTGPVSAASSHGSPAVILVVLNSALVTVFMCGLESAVFALLPLKFMEGKYIVSWSKVAWVSIFGAGAFLFVHILMRPSTGYVSGGAPSMTDVLIAAGSLFLISVSLWTYFHFFGEEDEDEAGDGGEGDEHGERDVLVPAGAV